MLLAPSPSLSLLLCRPAGSIQDVAIRGLSSGRLDLSAESLTPLGESSIAASSGSTSGVADRSSSGSLDLSEEPLVLSEEPLARVGSARSTPPSDRYLSGSLDLPAEPLAHGGSARSTAPADRVTLGLSVGVLMMVIETLRLVLCRRLWSAAPRKLVQLDDLSSLSLGIGHSLLKCSVG